MVRKPAKMYRNISKKAYTRRKYMGGVPGSKIVQFEMGNLSQEFPTEVTLIVEEACQIRHSALEAARITVNRKLMKDVGRSNFHFKVRIFPHHVLRENKQATGAGADRVSEGMRLAFGKAIGTAARVDANQKILTVYSSPQYLEKVKNALHHGGYKLPTPSHLKVSELKVSGRVVAAPKLVGEKAVAALIVEEAAAEPAKGAEAAKGGKAGATGKGAAAAAAKSAESAKVDEKKGAAHGPSHGKGGKSH
ncbi:MAG TPA: 50S ribosomal protein L16 [Methanoregula sp.]|nr:50S ribosomal protein L16 [Methanoregula sp.]